MSHWLAPGSMLRTKKIMMENIQSRSKYLIIAVHLFNLYKNINL